ncbi:hypothetical protein Ahia01_001347200 [Argonauta hians]
MARYSSFRTVWVFGVCSMIVVAMLNLADCQAQYDMNKPRELDYLSVKLENMLRRSELSDSAEQRLLNHRTKRVFCNTFGGCTSRMSFNLPKKQKVTRNSDRLRT